MWWLLSFPIAAHTQLPALEPLPVVSLDGFEQAVRSQLDEQRRQVDQQLATANGSAATIDERARRELGRAFGGLGELYLIYDLAEPARAALDNAARLDATSFRWSHLLGTLLQLDRDYAGAEAAFQRALELRPEYAAAMIRLGESQLEQRRHADARASYDSALDQSRFAPGYAGAAQYGLGRVALAEGDAAEAVSHFEQVLRAQPRAGRARYQLALAYRDLGERERARGSSSAAAREPRGRSAVPGPDRARAPAASAGRWRAARARPYCARRRRGCDRRGALPQGHGSDPSSAAAHRSLASVLQQQGRHEEALAEYEEAVRLEPEVAGLRFFVAELYVGRVSQRFAAATPEGAPMSGNDLSRLPAEARDSARADLERADHHLRAALEQAPDFLGGWVELAGVSSGLGRRGDAIDQLARALELKPDASDLRLFRARLLAAENRAGEAVAEYDRLAAASPPAEAATARFEAARVLERARQAEDAKSRYAALAGDVQLAAAGRAAAALHLGNLELEADNAAAAESQYRTATELDPTLVEAHFNLGTLLGRAGRYTEAAAEHSRVIELQPLHHEARFGEAMALVLAGEYEKAVARLQHALELYPSGAAYAHLLARVLVSAPDDAVRDGAVGLNLASRLFEALPSPEHAETLAMAFAESGRFDKAVEWQQRVVGELETAGRADLLGPAFERLEGYRQGKPARSPWR